MSSAARWSSSNPRQNKGPPDTLTCWDRRLLLYHGELGSYFFKFAFGMEFPKVSFRLRDRWTLSDTQLGGEAFDLPTSDKGTRSDLRTWSLSAWL
jgi:hypothetical protein